MTLFNFWPSWITWLPEEQRKEELFRLIRSGEKITTGRPKPKKGEFYQLYYGKRGGPKEFIAEVIPTNLFILDLNPAERTMSFEGQFLRDSAVQRVIDNDGFKDHTDAFWEYFYESHTLFFHQWLKPVEREVLGWRIKPKE